MTKGSIRKKGNGKKWYYRFYIEDETGKSVQKEFVGTTSKLETKALLRKAIADYEQKNLITKNNNFTLAEVIDLWKEEDLISNKLSNGTVRTYINIANRIKKHTISTKKIKLIKPEHLQIFFDSLSTSQLLLDGTYSTPSSPSTVIVYIAVMRGVFRFSMFPKQIISFDPMQYVAARGRYEDCEIFPEDNLNYKTNSPTITHNQYLQIIKYLKINKSPLLLSFQIAYHTGLRIGEVCGLVWEDIDLENKYLTVRRSAIYSNIRKCTVIGPTKRKKIRIVDFSSTLAIILENAKKEQDQNRNNFGNSYYQNYYTIEKIKTRTYYDINCIPIAKEVPSNFHKLSLVCIRSNGMFITNRSISNMCIRLRTKIDGIDGFHFHSLRHTFSSRLISKGAYPKDVQELLGHSDINTTINIYTHGSRESKKNAVELMDN